ncbi:sodium:proton antiporter [Roseibium polysiphoniae]|uniref:cation:proton antiporter n=1 Tax=Roseibium polysiphoniae TaxID=2571221 RepID=UPI002592BCED|nr:sodium:proton antiporter [uncultured Roseibium sp.]
MDAFVTGIALIGLTGIGAQWLAWRFQLPAIVLLLVFGVLAGPVTGVLQPDQMFGDLMQPLVGLAVAIILFEGGLTLNFHEISGTSKAVRRLVIVGATVAFLLGALNAYYIAGLSIWSAVIFAGILVVTGPTVIMPLLRQASLAQRPASLLRWEAILADPLGALIAVLFYEIFLVTTGAHHLEELAIRGVFALVLGLGGGWAIGQLLVRLFIGGHVPEYLKVPVILVTILAAYAVSNLVLEESGLLTVTVLGVALGNSKLASLTEVKRFKELMTILLVSGVFVLMTASLDLTTLAADLDLRALAFLVVLLFVVRPISVLVATIGCDLPLKERFFIGWIAPRGIVAVAVSGYFAGLLMSRGVEDGGRLTALAFAVVVVTVVAHGFSIGPLARTLGLSAGGGTGLLIVGSTPFSVALAERLKSLEIPVLIADRNWHRLRRARAAGIDTHYGEVLSEVAEHSLQLSSYSYMLAASDNDAYNTLVCTNYGPEIGRANVLQIGRDVTEQGETEFAVTLGGRSFLSSVGGYGALNSRLQEGWKFRATRLSDDYGPEDFERDRPEDTANVLVRTASGRLLAGPSLKARSLKSGDLLLSFGAPGTGKQPESETAQA